MLDPQGHPHLCAVLDVLAHNSKNWIPELRKALDVLRHSVFQQPQAFDGRSRVNLELDCIPLIWTAIIIRNRLRSQHRIRVVNLLVGTAAQSIKQSEQDFINPPPVEQ